MKCNTAIIPNLDKAKGIITNIRMENKLIIENKRLVKENCKLISKIVFLSKQVANRDIIIEGIQESSERCP